MYTHKPRWQCQIWHDLLRSWEEEVENAENAHGEKQPDDARYTNRKPAVQCAMKINANKCTYMYIHIIKCAYTYICVRVCECVCACEPIEALKETTKYPLAAAGGVGGGGEERSRSVWGLDNGLHPCFQWSRRSTNFIITLHLTSNRERGIHPHTHYGAHTHTHTHTRVHHLK